MTAQTLRNTAKYILPVIVILLVALFLLQGSPPGWADDAENQCISCHTTPRKLIGSVREAENERGSGPKVSTETEGEG